MNCKVLPFFFLFGMYTLNIAAQGFGEGTVVMKYNRYSLPSVMVGTGLLTFKGDVKNKKYYNVVNFTSGFNLSVEQRIGKIFGANLELQTGALSQNMSYPNHLRSFKSEIQSAAVTFKLFLDNGRIFRTTALFSPYFLAGAGFMKFNPMGDLKDAAGKRYFYWDVDATLRDKPYDKEHPDQGTIIYKDYTYETKLDSLNKIKHSSLTIPLGVGLSCKLTDLFEIKFQSTYYITQTDGIDNIYETDALANKAKDSYLYTAIMLQFNIGGKTHPLNTLFDGVDFKSIETKDSDGDGVKDLLDECAATLSGVKVDKLGCPVDTDSDGVPDYRDKEANSLKDAFVDENGVTITEEMIAEDLRKDSLRDAGETLELEYRKKNDMTPLQAATADNNAPSEMSIKPVRRARRTTTPAVAASTPPTTSVASPSVSTSASPKTTKTATGATVNSASSNPSVSPSVQSPATYTVQIGALSQPGQEQKVKDMYKLNEQVFVYESMGKYKYTVGRFNKISEANKFSEAFRTKHGINCFVIGVQNDAIIPVSQARKINNE